jgi:RecA-family ATPase
MLQLGSARSLSSQWLGEQVLPGRTLYFNYEDTARVVSDRGRRIAEHYDCATGDLSEFEVIDRAADGDEWVSFLPTHGKMQTTKEYDRAVATIEAAKADLVVIDGVSQVFGGNDIDKRQVRQFLQLLNRLAESYNVAIVLIAHPSKSRLEERTGKSGSEQWYNGARSFLHFERPPASANAIEDRDARLLRVTKNNYGPDDLELPLRHLGNGLIGRGGDPQKLAVRTNYDIDIKFLELLRHFNETNQNISPNRSNTYAPTIFARQADADGINKRQFEASMQRLFKTKQIAVQAAQVPCPR